MTSGFEVFNTAGLLQASSFWPSLSYFGNWPTIERSSGSRIYDTSIPKQGGQPPFICFLASDIPNGEVAALICITDFVTYWQVTTGGANVGKILAFYPSFEESERLNFGLETFNENGELTFSSAKRFLKILNMLPVSGSAASTTVSDVSSTAISVNSMSAGFQSVGPFPPNGYMNRVYANRVGRNANVVSCGQSLVANAPPTTSPCTFTPSPIRYFFLFDVSGLL